MKEVNILKLTYIVHLSDIYLITSIIYYSAHARIIADVRDQILLVDNTWNRRLTFESRIL